ncbi:MAG: hypothetical protein D6795_12190 [Deltaproteobacteria bacterium]|nr:MAG: hypothetical protein D6795_12190 [Deltaproteobacteria bacterium]
MSSPVVPPPSGSDPEVAEEDGEAPKPSSASEGEAPPGPPPSQPTPEAAEATESPETPKERGDPSPKARGASPPWEAYDFSVQVKQMRLDELTALLRRYEEVIPEAPRNEIEREIARRIVAEGESAGEEERAKLERQRGPSPTFQFLLLIGAAILFILLLFFVRTLVQRRTAYLPRGNTTQSGTFSPTPPSQGRGHRFTLQRASDLPRGGRSERSDTPRSAGGDASSRHLPHDGGGR